MDNTRSIFVPLRTFESYLGFSGSTILVSTADIEHIVSNRTSKPVKAPEREPTRRRKSLESTSTDRKLHVREEVSGYNQAISTKAI